MTCSCGTRLTHTVLHRQTSDGRHVFLDSEGQVWLSLLTVGRSLPEAVGRLVLEDVCLYRADELPALVSAARWAHEHAPRSPRTAMRKRAATLLGRDVLCPA